MDSIARFKKIKKLFSKSTLYFLLWGKIMSVYFALFKLKNLEHHLT